MVPKDIAAAIPADNPRTLTFVILAFVGLAATQLPLVCRDRGPGFGRRCYWLGTAGAAVCIVLAAAPNWLGGLGFSLFTVVAMTVGAYFTSSYIAIGGRILAFHTYDEHPETGRRGEPMSGEYGTGVTAPKAWWLLVALTGFCVFSVLVNYADPRSVRYALIAAVLVPLFGFGLGLVDASWGYRVARAQRVQFVLIAVITAAVFTNAYGVGYAVGMRWPFRPKSSLERSAEPEDH